MVSVALGLLWSRPPAQVDAGSGQANEDTPLAGELPVEYFGVVEKNGSRWHLSLINNMNRRYTLVPEGSEPSATLAEHHEAVARDQVNAARILREHRDERNRRTVNPVDHD
jgi:hypothetical protein